MLVKCDLNYLNVKCDKIKKLDSSDQKTDFHRCNVHCLCFLAQASLFLLLVSFVSGFFAAIWPWRPDSQSPLNSWCWDVSVTWALWFIWVAISEAGNPISRGNSGFSIPVVFLMRVFQQKTLTGTVVSAERKRQSERAHSRQNLSSINPIRFYGNNMQT